MYQYESLNWQEGPSSPEKTIQEGLVRPFVEKGYPWNSDKAVSSTMTKWPSTEHCKAAHRTPKKTGTLSRIPLIYHIAYIIAYIKYAFRLLHIQKYFFGHSPPVKFSARLIYGCPSPEKITFGSCFWGNIIWSIKNFFDENFFFGSKNRGCATWNPITPQLFFVYY